MNVESHQSLPGLFDWFNAQACPQPLPPGFFGI